jgi:hypothetical protein
MIRRPQSGPDADVAEGPSLGPDRTWEALGQWGNHRGADLTSSFTKDWTASAIRVGNSS